MLDRRRHRFCSEFYTIEKVIEVVVPLGEGDATIRIEAQRNEDTGRYRTVAYAEEHATLQPTYPQADGAFELAPQDYRLWVSYELPWTDSDTADGALEEALGFLEERCEAGATLES
jgi:hypothetical protein